MTAMTLYPYALFLHVVGALALGAANVVTLLVFSGIRGATTVTNIRFWGSVARRTRQLTAVSPVVLLLSGAYMVFTAWGWTTPWIDVSLALMVAMALLGPRVLGPGFARVGKSAAQTADCAISPELHALRDDQALWLGVATSTALYLSIIYLMTVKPTLLASLLTVVVALAVAVVVTLYLRSRGATVPQARAAA